LGIGIEHWALGIGHWALGIGHWALKARDRMPGCFVGRLSSS
jgi:hypothetical protein